MAFGDEIMKGVMNAADTVTKAVETGNFSNLSNDLSASFNDTANRIKQQTIQKNVYNSFMSSGASQGTGSGLNMTEQYILNKKKISVFQKAHVGKLTGAVSSFIYGFFTTIFGLVTLIAIPDTIFKASSGALTVAIMFGALTAIFGFCWKRAHDKKKLAKNFNLFKKAY